MSDPQATGHRLVSRDPADTERIGRELGAALRGGDVLEVNGPLGAGKTCLVRGMVAGAGGDPSAVRSPTFVLHQPHRGRAVTVHHVDLYRLGAGADIQFLDLDELLGDGAAAIEWGEYAELSRFGPTRVDIEPGNGQVRLLSMAAVAPQHLLDAWRRCAEPAR